MAETEAGSEGLGTLEKAAGIVPTLYYDIIARIIPGSAFIVAFTWNGQAALPRWIEKGEFGSGVLFIFFSYVSGMLLTAVGLIFDLAWMVLSWHIPNLWSPWDISHKIDEMTKKDPLGAAALLKMFAEVTLFENVLAAMAVCGVYSAFVARLPVTQHWAPMTVTALLALLGLGTRIMGVNERTRKLCGACNIKSPKLEQCLSVQHRTRATLLPLAFQGRCIGVSGTDTITVLDELEKKHRIRLAGIDGLQEGQPFVNEAHSALWNTLYNKPVRVEVIDVGSDHCEIAKVYCGKCFVNARMLREGFAWLPQYVMPEEFAAAEVGAREGRRGFWADKDPASPWEWRTAKLGAAAPNEHPRC
jgi:endonuclease YncB( thermonuclease family)